MSHPRAISLRPQYRPDAWAAAANLKTDHDPPPQTVDGKFSSQRRRGSKPVLDRTRSYSTRLRRPSSLSSIFWHRRTSKNSLLDESERIVQVVRGYAAPRLRGVGCPNGANLNQKRVSTGRSRPNRRIKRNHGSYVRIPHAWNYPMRRIDAWKEMLQTLVVLRT
jgi:hypothetical protein